MAPSVRYYNSSAPFWDFVASLEEQGSDHPMFGAAHNENNGNENRAEAPPVNTFPFAGPWGIWGRPDQAREFPHHGPPQGPPPEAGPDGNHPPPPFNEKEDAPESSETAEKSEPNQGEPSGPRCGPRGHHGPRGPWGRRGGRCGAGRDRFGGFGGPAAFGQSGIGALLELFQSQMTPGGGEGARARTDGNEDFEPEADVFDTEGAFIIHVSLAGAKKEDLGVSWDADKSELTISGVVHRPGDEDFLKTLSLDERKIGAFMRKIRLGSRANPAQIDVDAITAKLDDGILTVTVPKEDKDWTEVKKVDVE
jgi:HSP20 family protein